MTAREISVKTESWTPADPAPLGLAGFALTTFVLSMFNSNLVGSGGEPVVLGLALAYGGIAQLLAGMWEFRNGNTFGAVAFSSYGAFWISFWVLVTFSASAIPEAAIPSALGLYLWAWAIFTGYMFIASLRTTGAVALVFALLTITFVLLGIGNSGSDTLDHRMGRVPGPRDRRGRLVRVVRRGDQLDLRESRPPGRPAEKRVSDDAG